MQTFDDPRLNVVNEIVRELHYVQAKASQLVPSVRAHYWDFVSSARAVLPLPNEERVCCYGDYGPLDAAAYSARVDCRPVLSLILICRSDATVGTFWAKLWSYPMPMLYVPQYHMIVLFPERLDSLTMVSLGVLHELYHSHCAVRDGRAGQPAEERSPTNEYWDEEVAAWQYEASVMRALNPHCFDAVMSTAFQFLGNNIRVKNRNVDCPVLKLPQRAIVSLNPILGVAIGKRHIFNRVSTFSLMAHLHALGQWLPLEEASVARRELIRRAYGSMVDP